MLSGRCPSCGATVQFAHASAPTTVCKRCDSLVAQDANGLRDDGKVSRFARDLSPLDIGVRGEFGGTPFELVGVVRKGRAGVRWNEWAMRFGEQRLGWLAEANGMYAVYAHDGQSATGLPGWSELSAGQVFKLGKRAMRVVEVGQAQVLAAEGTLAAPVSVLSPLKYVDIADLSGEVLGTLDYEGAPTLYLGEPVRLSDLKLKGLRALTGWGPDPKMGVDGVETEGSRTLSCPNCGGVIALRSPGGSVSVACEHCGSVLALAEAAGELTANLVSEDVAQQAKLTVPLGSRFTLDGIEWAVVGAMRRGVSWDGQMFTWLEYQAFNPWHGWRFLIEDEGARHWAWLERVHAVPVLHKRGAFTFDGSTWRHFQRGRAQVLWVRGEFTWQVELGAMAITDDYVSPPELFSIEQEGEEVAASRGRYLSLAEVRAALPAALRDRVRSQSGVAPAQPNPWEALFAAALCWGGVALGVMCASVLFIAATVLANPTPLATLSAVTTPNPEDIVVSQVFEVPDRQRRSVTVKVISGLDSATNQVHVALLGQTDGVATHVGISGRTAGSGQATTLSPGLYTARLEVAKAPGTSSAGERVNVELVLDEPDRTLAGLLLLFSLSGGVVWVAGRAMFERQRWSMSDYA